MNIYYSGGPRYQEGEDKAKSFEEVIYQAYKDRHRDLVEASGHLMIEAGELAELFHKQRWYNKDYSKSEVLSEAGDVLNFLTFILNQHGLSLKDAMADNESKLRERGWIK